ncbi:beta-ketoacyl-[acyl-carrier-protein] synthase family protein [Flavitalea flava]
MDKKNNPGVFVAGVGIISAIGNDVAECLSALEHKQAGMGDITYLETAHRQKIPVAEVKLSNEELALLAGVSYGPAGTASPVSRTALLSKVAAKAALDDAGLKNRSSLRTGFISANTVGGMDKTEKFFASFLTYPRKGKLRDVLLHECGSVTEWVADQLDITDYITTISTACSSSANAIFFGARMIRQGLLDVAVTGGADALTKFTLNGFNTLMILDQEPCKPFDENRNGLNLGEGAGYIVLVSERVAASMATELYCRLSGYCNANDAYHQTASSPDGTGSYLAMIGALERSGLQPSDINYINLHGTGTQNNDLAEGTAIKRLFEPTYPRMSSTKSFTGHTLGASGGIEAVLSALSVRQGLIYPNLRFQTQMTGLPFAPETNFFKNERIGHVLSNSFGFGGNCSSLIFSTC